MRVFGLLALAAGAALLAAASPCTASGSVASIITRDTFYYMLMLTQGHHGGGCEGGAFYTYDAFVEAASTFPSFGTTGDQATRRRELAAFCAQTSHQTTGYCWVKRRSPAAAGGQYYGRGPMQLTHEYNYRRAGDALGLDLVRRPDLVSTDPVVAFKTAIWFWMTPRHGAHKRPSCHAVMTGGWTPSRRDRRAGRLPGYGMTTNIISGGLACGRRHGTPQAQGRDRVGYYKRYCRLLRVRLGRNVACINHKPYGHGR